MTIYVINENVANEQLSAIQKSARESGVASIIAAWPNGNASLPTDLESTILIISPVNSNLDALRARAVVAADKQIICIHIEVVEQPSELVRNICSSKVTLDGLGLGQALKGDDTIQEGPDGSPAEKNPQKPHRC